jgi:hypothetical protein
MSELIRIKQIDGLSSVLATKAADAEVLKIANNLSEVNANSVRSNLGLYSKSEVDALVVGAKNAYNVADLTARNALTGLKLTDRVFVNDDGDGKWALYIVTAITTGTGSTSTFKKIADEDLFTNAITASAIKAAYESNADTYPFNGAYKGKLDKITVAANVNLDTIKSTADTALSNAANAQSSANSAAAAAANAQNTANAAGISASNSQSTANSSYALASEAISIANAKQEAFTEITESFTGMNWETEQEVFISLSQPVKNGTEVLVFFNGLRVLNVNNNRGESTVRFTVPYSTESIDVITVTYKY